VPDEGSLFRPEAIEAARTRTGAPVNNQGLPTWLIVGFMTALFVCTVAFLLSTTYTKRESVPGQVVPAAGVTRVVSSRSGVVKSVLVGSGQLVTEGQALFSLSYDTVLEDREALGPINGKAGEAELNFAELVSRQKQYEQSGDLILARIKRAKDEGPSLERQKRLLADRLDIYKTDYESAEKLFEKGFATQSLVAQKKDAWLDAEQRLIDLDTEIHRVELELVELGVELANNQQQLVAARALTQRPRPQTDGRRPDNRSSQGAQVVALGNGRLTALQAKPGDPVGAGQTLGLIVPEDGKRQEVELWVPSRAIGFVQRGNKVRLLFDSFPYQTFGAGSGTVADIALAPMIPTNISLPQSPTQPPERMYKVTVDLDRDVLEAYGRTWPLRAGMRLTADIVLDRKSLFGWLLDPITATRKRAEF
jgi:membrane fusion protein